MLGYFIGYIYKYRQSVCIQNLSRAFPHLSYRDINEHRRNFYTNTGRILWEIFLFGRGKLKLSDTAIYTINRLAEEQRQAVFLAGHYGNWEVLNQLPKFTNIPVHALYRPLKNRAFDVFIYKRRTRHGMRLLPAKRAMRILLREKSAPSITLFIADQFPGHNNGVAVTFLRQQTFMFSGAEQLAKRLNAYVGYMYPPYQVHIF